MRVRFRVPGCNSTPQIHTDAILGERVGNFAFRSPLRAIPIGDEFEAIGLAKTLQEEGFAVTTALYPTVERGQAIHRVALSASHSEQDIRSLFECYRSHLPLGIRPRAVKDSE